jgi:hypothetical protein
MCDSIANGPPRYVAAASQPCPPANVIIASNVLATNGNVIAGNVISVDGIFTGNLYVAGSIVSNISYSALNVTGTINASTFSGTAYLGNGYGLSNLNASNLTGTIQDTNLPVVGATGTYGDFSNVSRVTIDQYGRVTAAANVAILSSQWTSVAGNVAYQNGVSIGTLSAPPPGSNLLVLGTANMTTLNVTTLFANSATIFGSQTLNVLGVSNLAYVVGDGGGLSNVQSSVLVGNVARANVALVVSQPFQPNITQVGTLVGLYASGNVSAPFFVGGGNALSNVQSSGLVGNVASANTALVVTQPFQPNITSVGTLSSLGVSGGVTAGTFYGSGSGLSGVPVANLVGTVDYSNTAGAVVNPAQPNITSLGTLSSLGVSGGVTAGTFYGSGSGLSGVPVANLVGTVDYSNTAGAVVNPAQPNITSLGTLTSLTVSGSFSAQGNAVTNVQTALVVTQAAQPNITSVGTLTSLQVTGSVTGGTFYGSGAGLTNVPVGNLIGTVNYANTAGAVVNPAQPNITSLGSLTTLSVIGSLIAGTISGDGQGLYGIHASAITETVATANSVVQPAQPNITSLGTLTGLTISGLLVASNASGLSNINASNLALGTLSTGVFPASGVTAGLYGSSANVSQVTVDQYGRVTGASNVAIISSQWTGAIGDPIYYQNFVGVGAATVPSATLQVTGNVYASNSVTVPNLFFTNQIQPTNLPASGVTAGLYGSGANVSQVVIDQYGRVTAAANVATQWTTVAGNVAYQNGVSIGTLSAPPTGSNLYVLGLATMTNVAANGAALSALQASNIVGNVAQANIALVVSQPAQPNITSVGTLTGLTVNGLLSASNGSGIANLTAAAITGNVAQANVALVVSQAAQPNVTSLGTLTGLTVNGLLSSTNGSGIANLTAAAITGNVAQANVALVVSQPAQPNVTSLGTLTGLTVNGLLSSTNGSGIANLTAAAITGNVAQANVALVVSQAAQPNVTSVGTLTGLTVQGLLSASNGSGIANLTAAAITGNVAQANVALVVSQPFQPNITQVGTLVGLYSSGNVTASFFAGQGNALTNVQSAALVGNVANANVALVVSQPLQPNITQVGTLVGLYSTGNVTASFFAGQGNALINVQSAALVGNVAAANVALVVSQPLQPNITQVGTLEGLYSSGNVTASFFAGQGNALTNVQSAALVGNVANANVALVVSQPLQPNITQVGTLLGLYSTGNVTASFFSGQGNALTNVQSAALVGNVASANVALVVSQPLQPNITQVGTLVGLYSTGNVTASFFSGQGNALTNVTSAALVGNVANANVALVVSQPAQPNVTSLGTLTGLTVNGLLSSTNGSGISNLTAAAITGNVANANVALVVSQAAQPNVTSLGTLTGLTVNGLLSSTNGSGIANLTAAAITGNVSNANVALVVSQASQPNVTSLGTLTGLTVNGLLSSTNGSGIANLTAAAITGNVANANVSLVVSQAYQPNITSVANLTVNNNFSVSGNIVPVTLGNTYVTGNLVVAGNVFSSLGVPLGEGGGYYFSLPGDVALQTPYTGALYGTTYPLSLGLSNGWTITGTSTLITVTPNGNFKFNKAGAYKLSAVFQGSTDNITGLGVGSNVADIHGTDQAYQYRYTTFITQNPTELIEIPLVVTDASKYYFLDVWCVDGGALKATATGTGGTYLTITPLQGGGLASGGPGGTPGTQWINSGSNIYFSNSVGIGAVNPQYNLDVSGGTTASKFMLVSNISSLGGPILNITSNVQISANLAVGGVVASTPPYALYVTGQGYFSQHVSFENFSGYRNRLINGTFRIANRANTLTISNASVFSLSNAFVMDRWRADVGNLSTSNVAMTIRQDVSVGPSNGFSNVANVYVTRAFGATTDNTWICPLVQTVEASGTYDLRFGQPTAKPMVLSFYANAAVTGNYSVVLRSKADNTYFANLVTLTNSWNRYTVYVPACTIGTWGAGTAGSIEVCLLGVSFGSGRANVAPTTSWTASPGYAPVAVTGAINWMASAPSRLQVTGVQLELGTITTPFEIRLLSETVRMCQRYYETNPDIQYAAALGSGRINSIPYVVTKRDHANVTVFRDLSNLTANTNVSQFVAYYGDGTLKGTQAINSYLSSEYGFSFNFTNTGSKFMDGSIMEAQFVWQADSEIY